MTRNDDDLAPLLLFSRWNRRVADLDLSCRLYRVLNGRRSE